LKVKVSSPSESHTVICAWVFWLQAERLAALEAEARANILQAQEKQKLSYARRQLHGVVHSQRLRSATRLVHFAPLASSMAAMFIEDAKGAKWTKRVADLSLWE